jgi:1-aminocyclopropane-1-carboxylate deaminase/D-cysteine desulfhydrase-like pyridoxal-dependent ACC family enzyme
MMLEQPAPSSFQWIRDRIARVPRVKIAITPTPLEEAPNLTKALGGPRIFIKRDDLTGVALGGNKLRNLEFRLARTMAENPDTVIVGLDLQSNSARQTVGACNKLGLRTILVLEGRRPDIVQGNLLMDYLLGAEVHFAESREQQRQMLDKLAVDCREAGGRPHILNDNPMFDVASVENRCNCERDGSRPRPGSRDHRGRHYKRRPLRWRRLRDP